MTTVEDYAKKHSEKNSKPSKNSKNFTDFVTGQCCKYPNSPIMKALLNKEKINLLNFNKEEFSTDYTGAERSNMFE